MLDGFLPPIIKELQDNSLAKLAIPVLYNICVDYGTTPTILFEKFKTDYIQEPAQEAVRSHSLCSEIIRLLARDSFESHHLLSYICSLLNYSIQECKPSKSSFPSKLRIQSSPRLLQLMSTYARIIQSKFSYKLLRTQKSR